MEGRALHRDWHRFLREVWESIGWSSSVPVYEHLYMPAFAMVSNGSTAAVDGGVFAMAAADAANTFFDWSFRLPSSYVAGTDVGIYAEWCGLAAGTDNVVLRNAYGFAAVGEELTEADSTDYTAAAAGDGIIVRTTLDDIPGGSLVKGSTIIGGLSRRGNDAADTLAASIALMGVGLIFRREGIGREVRHP